MYFISTVTKSWTDAYADCCKRNMTLLALETDQEHKCMSKEIITNSYGNYFRVTNQYFWTAGSDFGVEGAYKWCYPTRADNVTITPLITWFPGDPDDRAVSQNCLIVIMLPADTTSVLRLADVTCTDLYPYVCESKTSNPTPFPECPPTAPVEPSKSALVAAAVANLTANASLKFVNTSAGLVFFRCSGKNYFYQNTQLNFAQAISECSKYGVQTLSLETKAELDCLYAFNRDYAQQAAYFWTSGTNKGPLTARSFGWCATKSFFPGQNESGIWDLDQSQPDGFWNERCIALDWQKSALYMNGMHDYPCDWFINIICEI